MDADLQHPPHVIGKMLSLWRDGYDMVVPVNEKRTYQGIVSRSAARVFYRIMRRLSRVDIVPNGSDFRLMDRKVIDVIRQLREIRRFMKAIYAWPGYSVCTFPYDVRERQGGRSTWNLWGLWNFALEGIFNFSSLPLRIWTYLGFAIAIVAGVWGLSIGIRALIYGPNVVQGVTTVAVFVFFTLALVMIQGGIQGEYLARIFDEVKRRPLYVVRKVYRYKDNAAEKEAALDEAVDQRG
jgi:glycosyltransferase involved in cell wall biosynthesis